MREIAHRVTQRFAQLISQVGIGVAQFLSNACPAIVVTQREWIHRSSPPCGDTHGSGHAEILAQMAEPMIDEGKARTSKVA
jgi:hypothetical protein